MSFEIGRLLLDFNNADTPYKSGISSPILLALENNDSEMIILLLELNVTIHFENKNIEENPLAIAIKQAKPPVLKILLFNKHSPIIKFEVLKKYIKLTDELIKENPNKLEFKEIKKLLEEKSEFKDAKKAKINELGNDNSAGKIIDTSPRTKYLI